MAINVTEHWFDLATCSIFVTLFPNISLAVSGITCHSLTTDCDCTTSHKTHTQEQTHSQVRTVSTTLQSLGASEIANIFHCA